ncbi:MAG: hypothetical protein QOE90_191 [Thermoplasmata archaeon]|jgi:PAS domain S-box-containing protein|nr:hypothetical protein [Thermoplasmata archaeon]
MRFRALWSALAGRRTPAGESEMHQREVRRALDALVLESLVSLTLGIGALYLAFSLADGILRVREPSLLFSALDAAAGGVLLTVHVLIRRHRFAARLGHPILALVSGVVLADLALTMLLIPTPDQTLYLILFAIGVGGLALSTTWLAGMLGACIGVWIPFVALRPNAGWTTASFGLAAGLVLAMTFHLVRMRTYERMESLRLQESRRKAELEIREEALQGAVQAAQESEERYRRLVENAPDAFLVHSGGRVVYANAAAGRLFGAKAADELLGADPFSLIHPDHLADVMARSALVEHHGQTTPRMEIRILRLDGKAVDVEVTSQPMVYAGRPADQAILRDITDRIQVEAERAINAKRAAEIERLRELDRLKTQFVNTLSHELRTPLTPLKVQLHILKNAPQEGPARQRAMDMLERNLARLSSLVDEFLEVARIQSGGLKLSKARADAGPILHESLESYHDVARANGVKLEVALDPALWADLDPKRISQVVFNLVGNAMKFTPKGGTIRVEARRKADAIQVRVSDTGVGLSAADIAKLFEPFSQAHDTMQKTNAGTGLGLFICRGIVESHGGRIGVDSDGPGKGSCFWFTLPAADGPEADPQAPHAETR